MWVPPEIKDPIQRHTPTRKSISCFGAVSLDTGQFIRMMCPIFNAATFRTFLRRLLRQQTPGRRMIVVLDNARYHYARLLVDFPAAPRSTATPAVPAALQPAAGSNRASVEAGSAPGHSQSLVRHVARSAESRQR